MDFYKIYHFLFETYAGIGCLIGIFLVASVIVAVITEKRTKRIFRDRGSQPNDSWDFDDEDSADQ